MEGLSLVLLNSLFQFNDEIYRLKTGTATGTKVAPTYANLVMAYLETKLYTAVYNTFGYEIHGYIVKNWFRFLDDGFIFWKKSFGDIEVFVNLLNNLDSTLKFTHESSEEKISFLNISIFKKNNTFETDVYYKKTDNHDYLPFKSCHPRHCKDNIPFTLARIVCTIVSDNTLRDQRLTELSTWLLNSGYPFDKIWEAFEKVKAIDQKVLRQKVNRDEKDQITFVSKNNPKNPPVFGKLMTFINCLGVGANEKFNRIFGNVEFIQSKRQPQNLGDILQHSYYGTEKFSHGVTKCPDSSCATCKYLEEGRAAYFPNADVTIKIRHKFSCDSGYLLYKLTCQGCNGYYIGRTTCLKDRLANHKLKTENKNYRLLAVYINFFNCANDKLVKFKMMPYFKLHCHKISDMAIIERHHIDWLKPDLNTL